MAKFKSLPRRRYSIGQARDNLAAIVHEAEEGRPVEITRHGRPVAAIVPPEMLNRSSAPDLWKRLIDFRSKTDLEKTDLGPDLFSGLRAREAGRDPHL